MPRPTSQGIVLVGVGGAVVGAGRFFGLIELFAIGTALVLLVVGGLALVVVRPGSLRIDRRMRSTRLHAGNTCIVDLTVDNAARRRSPVVRIHDPVTGTSGASLLLPPCAPAGATSVSYALPTMRRGVLTIGPMTVERTDPFGLVRRREVVISAIEATVFPHVDDIPPLRRSLVPDPSGATETGSLGRSGEDFAGLREYVVGDDLRQVHWPSSARSGELLVRQRDIPWQARVCVVLDDRGPAGGSERFERAVSAAASIVRAHSRRGDHVRLVTASGSDTGHGTGIAHLDRMLERLAVVESGPGDLTAALRAVEEGGSGAVVLVSVAPSDADVARFEQVSPTFTSRRVVRFDGSRRTSTPMRTDILGVGDGDRFSTTWTSATRSRPSRPSGSRR